MTPGTQIHFPTEQLSRLSLPYFLALVPAGFPSPAADYVEGRLDLNSLLVHRPAATFFVRISGDSMIGAGIFTGDLAIVDRSVTPERGDVVVAIIGGDLTLKTIQWDGPRSARTNIRLEPANPDYSPIMITEGEDLIVWGVVTATIRQRRR